MHSIVSPGRLLCKYLLHESHNNNIRKSVLSLRTSLSSSSTFWSCLVKKVTCFSLSNNFCWEVSHAFNSSGSFMLLYTNPFSHQHIYNTLFARSTLFIDDTGQFFFARSATPTIMIHGLFLTFLLLLLRRRRGRARLRRRPGARAHACFLAPRGGQARFVLQHKRLKNTQRHCFFFSWRLVHPCFLLQACTRLFVLGC